jgi:molybdate transport system substrate-binding protein
MNSTSRPRITRSLLALLAALLLLVTTAGCGSSSEDTQTLDVFAAASLSKTFPKIAEQFEADHDGVKVRFNFGGSSDLVEQIKGGAPADVFASADTANMDKLGSDAVDPQTFATNTLQIVVPAGNPANITSFADLAKPGVKLVICAPEVPCGTASQTAATAAKVELKPVSQEQSVTDVLGKVTAGEADAGLVYVTDVKGAGAAVEGISFPAAQQAVNIYPISTLAEAKEKTLAKEFVELVLSAKGQQVLADAGFGKP